MDASQAINQPAAQPSSVPPQPHYLSGPAYYPPSCHPVHVPYYAYPPAPPTDSAHRLSIDKEIDLRVRVQTLERQLEDVERQKAEAELAVLFLAKHTSNTNSGNKGVPKPDTDATLTEQLCCAERNNETLRAQLLQMSSLLVEFAAKSRDSSAPKMGNLISSNASTLVDDEEKEVEQLSENTESVATTADAKQKKEKINGAVEEEEEDGGEISSSYESEVHASLSSSFSSNTNNSVYISRFVKEKKVVKEGDDGNTKHPTPPSSVSSPIPASSHESSSASSPLIPSAPTMPKVCLQRLRGG